MIPSQILPLASLDEMQADVMQSVHRFFSSRIWEFAGYGATAFIAFVLVIVIIFALIMMLQR